jgi:hypothetical protein
MYGVANRGWPSLEVLDLATGERYAFRSHACDPAWGEDDEIAYVHYVRFDSDTGASSGEIRVQHGLSGPPRAWTGNGARANPIWAGRDLLADHFNDLITNPSPLIVLYVRTTSAASAVMFAGWGRSSQWLHSTPRGPKRCSTPNDPVRAAPVQAPKTSPRFYA